MKNINQEPSLDLIFVDDEHDVGVISEMNFRQAVKNGTLNFHFFDNANQCIEYLQTPSQDRRLVITDINMPEVSGFELLEEIKRRHPSTQVFMMSAYDDAESQKKSLNLGASAYFTKPVSYKNIKSRISQEYGIPL